MQLYANKNSKIKPKLLFPFLRHCAKDGTETNYPQSEEGG